jgi:hypothetical protein
VLLLCSLREQWLHPNPLSSVLSLPSAFLSTPKIRGSLRCTTETSFQQGTSICAFPEENAATEPTSNSPKRNDGGFIMETGYRAFHSIRTKEWRHSASSSRARSTTRIHWEAPGGTAQEMLSGASEACGCY